ncbi:Bug family tripartite tricarboxylate transporter substrate binding protein [Pseudooceanicola spongiae]|jgi:tripartite-type tricarboxylate transporter receptor subunit TctC|uniref:Tripartite tricarboxylate transporter substrate binding protein n=1 Tax=Pseudooceanicola spongiae TaxID=2613965 RepID=A0A7L9WRD5_9RHOB|nr:tripartite tricarboxylate transporter substrate binding protein [Pseudooceanicola spongiae]QOL82473.1 tripartite tricarboxylate transporter substrate binding protein [Pseudooceanicola spongiae]
MKPHALLALAASALFATSAVAEPGKWSDTPVRIVVTFPPGGTSDLVARILAQYLDSEFGQKAVVDNRPGAGGTVAADYVAQQPADGTTLILGNNAPFTIAPTQFESLPYDPVASFTHIANLGASTPGLFVQPSLGITDLDGFIALAKGDGVTYGSSGVGSITHILGQAVDTALQIETIHVPYQGSAPAIQDFRAGVLDAFYDSMAQNSAMIEDGEVVPLAVAAPERSKRFPEIPTFREQGYDVVIENWTGLSGPAGMDPAMVQTIHDSVEQIMAIPAVIEQMDQWGIAHTAMTTEDFSSFVANTITVWRPLIEAANVNGG